MMATSDNVFQLIVKMADIYDMYTIIYVNEAADTEAMQSKCTKNDNNGLTGTLNLNHNNIT